MAIYAAGYLSPIRKKLGNAVGRKWRTLDVLAVYQPFVSNPNTTAQQLVRTRFGAAAHLAMCLSGAVEQGFLSICKGTKVPQRSMFIKKNWDNIHADTPGTPTIDYTEIIVADGSLQTPDVVGNASFADPLAVDITLTAYSGAASPVIDALDKVIAVVYDTEAQMCYMKDGVRGDNGITVTVNSYSNGHRVHVWAFAVGAGTLDEGKVSPSVYLGSGVIS